MTNNFGNPYMSNPYMANPYTPPIAYGSSQNRMAMLEQQKRDIENQISMLQQSQQTPMNQPLTINNNIVPNQNTQQGSYDFNGRFIKNEDEIKEVFNNNLPVILMSSEDSKFYIKNLDGTVTKYRFEEIKEDEKNKETVINNNNEEMESLKRQVQEQGMYLNQIIALLQTNNQQSNINNSIVENASQIEENKPNQESIIATKSKTRKTSTNSATIKGDK